MQNNGLIPSGCVDIDIDIVTVGIYKPFLLLVLYSFNPYLQPHKIKEPSSQLSRENWDPRSAVQYPEFVSHEGSA